MNTKNVVIGSIIVCLLALVGWLAPTLKKTTEELTKVKTTITTKDQEISKLTTENQSIKTQYSKLVNKAKRVKMCGNAPCLDAHGNPIYEWEYTSTTQASSDTEIVKQENLQLKTRVVALTEELEKYKKVTVTKRNKGMLYAGFTTNSLTADNKTAALGGHLNILGNIWVGGQESFAVSNVGKFDFQPLMVTLGIGF